MTIGQQAVNSWKFCQSGQSPQLLHKVMRMRTSWKENLSERLWPMLATANGGCNFRYPLSLARRELWFSVNELSESTTFQELSRTFCLKCPNIFWCHAIAERLVSMNIIKQQSLVHQKTELEQLPVCRYVVLVDECSVVGKSQKLCGSSVSHRGAGQCVFWSTQRQHTTADLKFPSEARLLRVSIVCVHALHKNMFSLLQFFF